MAKTSGPPKISIRPTPAEKALFEKAAAIARRSLNQWALAELVHAARRDLDNGPVPAVTGHKTPKPRKKKRG